MRKVFLFFVLVVVLGVVAQSRVVRDFLPAHLAALTSGLFIEKGVAPEELNTA